MKKLKLNCPLHHKAYSHDDVNSNLTNLYRCVREQPEERRTAAGEMLPLHLVQAATNILKTYFMLFSGENMPTFAAKPHWEAIAGTGSVPAD